MSSTPEIAIIGVGLHPFGRYEDRSALEMGAVAISRALRDAGVQWSDVGSLYAGSLEVANPEAVTAAGRHDRHPGAGHAERLRDR